MHDLVRGLCGQRVERRQRWRLGRPPQHVRPGPLAGVPHVLQRGRPQQLRDQLQLLDRVLGLEEDPPAEQLAEYAADGPDVHRRRVVPRPHQDLGGPVILRHHLLGHVLARVGLLHAGQAEITDLEGGKD